MQENNKWWQSSTGDGSVSLTLKSSLLGLVPILIFGLQIYGVEMTEGEAVEIVNQIVAFVSIVGILLGTARKIYYNL